MEEQVFTQIMTRLDRIEGLIGTQANITQSHYCEIKNELGEIKTSLVETKTKQNDIIRRVSTLEEKSRYVARTAVGAIISALISIVVAFIKLI